MILILEHFGGVMFKSDAFSEKLDCLTSVELFCNDAVIAITSMQVVLDLYQTC